MYTVKLFKLLPSTFGVLLTWAPYSEGEVENLLIENIRNMVMLKKEKSNYFGNIAFNEIIKNIHDLFLENGNKDEYKKRYNRDGFKWYKAYSQVLIINKYKKDSEEYFEYAYIGQIPVYQSCKLNNKFESVNYIHNVKNEVEKNTIEESCLSPFHSRSNEDIAKQIMPGESKVIIDMVSNCDRETFINTKLPHSLTRNVGYFQKAGSDQIPDYRIEAPKITYGCKRISKEDIIVVYIPEARDIMPFSQEKLNGIVKTKFYEKIKNSKVVRDNLELKNGDVVTFDTFDEDFKASILTHK